MKCFMALMSILAFIPASLRDKPETAFIAEGDYVRHMDGDTAMFEITYRLRIRFADCWCGETDSRDPVEKKLGKEAKQYLSNLADANHGKWTVEIPTAKMRNGDLADINTLGRWVGYVYLPEPDGRCVNDLLVEAKLAGRTKEELKQLIEARRE